VADEVDGEGLVSRTGGRGTIGLVSSEPLRPVMAGIGIRYVEMARSLGRDGGRVVLVHPGDPGLTPDAGRSVEARAFAGGALRSLLGDCDAVVAQGQLANDTVLELPPELPIAIDLYDPWLLENLHYTETLGLDPFRNDHRSWVLQLSRGDFFLCASEEQRDFYLGFLTALGRVNPERLRIDPDLRGLIDVVPFGVPEVLPPHRPWLDTAAGEAPRLLFGGLYEWYDPWTLLEALDSLLDLRWRLLFARNPNAGDPNAGHTPQALLARVERWAAERGPGWRDRLELFDWAPFERRFDLLRDVSLLISTHADGIETRLSLRTRFLDAMAAGCPVVTSDGGAVANIVRERGAGWVVPRGDAAALARTLREILATPEAARSRVEIGRATARSFTWSRALEPLARFCRAPAVDPTRDAFAFRPQTPIPADDWRFRIRRRLGVLRDGTFGSGGGRRST
jgi:glycosyltransferase involved in cell wall biosynthesis